MTSYAKIIGRDFSLVPAEQDAPLHGLYRTLINPLFTPKATKRLDERITTYVREYIGAFAARGSCELMREFAFEFPIKVFLELLGLDQSLAGQFLIWEDAMLHNGDREVFANAARAVFDYLSREIDRRRETPTDDFISFALTSEIQGRKLTEEEIMGFCFNMYLGGLDTISTHMGYIFLHLAEHPEDQAFLRSDPSRIPDAIDEMMRAYGSVIATRICVADVDLAGVTVKAGDRVLIPTMLAARDPEEFPDPDRVDFRRKPRHMSFGYGPHLCLGMHLARRELRIALEQFLAMVPTFTRPEGAEIVNELGIIAQPMTVPLAWDPQAVSVESSRPVHGPSKQEKSA
jgi:cytochrome P450